MTRRKLIGKIYDASENPYPNIKGVFRLITDDHTDNFQVASTSVEFVTDADGNISNGNDIGVYLWCNEEGKKSSKFVCKINGLSCFQFSVPVGTTDIDISSLRMA